MAKATTSIELTEDQVLYFRARRGHLAGSGAPAAATAARAIIGAQAQQLPPALLALSQRTNGRPAASLIRQQLFVEPRTLVRTWGQRDTLHVYDPATDWATVVAARGQWAPGGRGGPMPSETTVAKARAAMESAGIPVTRSDLISVAPASYVRAINARAAAAGMDARRLAAGRLVWRLAQDGHACVAETVGNEQAYALRSAWFPALPWPDQVNDGVAAACALARRYLASYGPATPRDLAHFFGARVTAVRGWISRLEPELLPVSCGGRAGLVALAADAADLRRKPPASATGWPVRLLPLWDSMLMGHADKSWTVPDEAERPVIWRKAGFIAATVIDRGRVVATWSSSTRGRRLVIEVSPLRGWRKRRHAAPVRREAGTIAAHLELDGAEVSFT